MHLSNSPEPVEVKPPEAQVSLQPVKDRKSLAIALVVAAIFLLAAAGIATWLFLQKQPSSAPVAVVDPNDTTLVTNVQWMPPDTIPASYVWSDQSTLDSEVSYYADAEAGCSITTRIMPASDDDFEDIVIKANDTEGIQAQTVSDISPITIGDAEGAQLYEFAGFNADQSVNVPAVDFDKQSSAIYYKQFGQQIATVAFSCKLSVFEANAEDLKVILEQFKVKTER